MKRLHVEYFEHLERHFSSLFWWNCCMCGRDFRREWGWRALTGSRYGGLGEGIRFICGTCAPTKARATEILLKRPWLREGLFLPKKGARSGHST